MKSVFFLLLGIISSLFSFTPLLAFSFAPSDSVIWQGQTGMKRLILRWHTSIQKSFPVVILQPESYYSVPDTGIATLNGDSISVSCKRSGMGFNGFFSKRSTQLQGQASLGDSKVLFSLHRISKIMDISTPQDPKPPFPYQIENVHFSNKDSSIRFGATVTVPNKNKKNPVVILVSGTGPQDRDGTMARHKMFWILADYLSRKGIAVLRMDDRGVRETTGDYMAATTADFAADVKTAIEYLKSRKDINPKQIGLIGHSEGGIVISLVAASSPDVAFMVSLAGVGLSGLDVTITQNDALLRKSRLPEEHVEKFNELFKIWFTTVRDNASATDLDTKIKDAFSSWKATQNQELLSKMNLLEYRGDNFTQRYIRQATTPWYRYMIQYDPARVVTKIKVPVLALNGDKDLMVVGKENLASFDKYLKEGGNNDFKTVLLPGLNHLFQYCKTCTNEESSELEETFSPEALQMISNWISQHLTSGK
ncbi:alpha/beta hydrolase [Cytophagaceae bacterium DM2B3-1]|uniref:Alpha/beta hydrolase n=1 Tax=Xanthocytophaga flava TaxID=3048013 RepID=A0ABT7CEU4_9BACT|nr:alpha/beta hydrolase [Xanthocytophaga flavus]MDJ1492173.1 alpha/beta hydrolase [Xanthocytophaga flavus]